MAFTTDSTEEEPYVIAFSVTANHNENIDGGASVQYHTKLTDVTESFDLETGIYTVKVSGYYIIHFFRYVLCLSSKQSKNTNLYTLTKRKVTDMLQKFAMKKISILMRVSE